MVCGDGCGHPTEADSWHLVLVLLTICSCKFICLTRSEAKQAETLEFGAENVYFRALQGDKVAHALKSHQGMCVCSVRSHSLQPHGL